MRLICYWRQRQLTRHSVLGAAIRPQSFLGRHLASCKDCARAQREMACLQSDLAAFAPPALTPDFDARLLARFQSELKGGPKRVGARTSVFQRDGAFSWPLRMAVAGIVFGVLTLWYFRSAPNLPHESTKPVGRDNQLALLSPRKADANPKVVVFNTAKPVQGDKERTPATLSSGTVPALRGLSPYSWPRSERRRYRAVRVHRHRRRSSGGFDKTFDKTSVVRAVQQHAGSVNKPSPPQSVRIALLTPVMDSAPSWRALGRVYETCGDFSRATQAYGQAFADQPDADFALAASASAERAGDKSTSLEYYARVLAAEPSEISVKPLYTNTAAETKGNPE